MTSDEKRLKEAFQHIVRIKVGTYPAVIGRDEQYRIEERPWNDVPERSKLAILTEAVNWEGVTNRDQAHILLSEVDPGKISDTQRNQLIETATVEEDKARLSGRRER